MRSKLNVGGHPLHVIYVDFPIAFWTGSFLADVLYLWRGDLYWFDVAFHLMIAGLAFSVLAASTGLFDYWKTVPPHSDAKSTARTHGLVNGGIVLLYLGNTWLRTSDVVTTGNGWWIAFGLSILGVALLVYTGYLGGDLVYNYRMGVRHKNVEGRPTIYGPSKSASSGAFVEVARADELEPGQLKHVVVNGAWLVIARTEEGYRAIDGICTHEGGPLCDGVLMGETLQCPWHGSRFDVRTGEFMAGPTRKAIGTHALKLEGDRVLVQAPAGSEAVAAAG